MAKFIEVELCNINLENMVSIKIVQVGNGYEVTLLDINKVPYTLFCNRDDPVFQNLTLWIKENSLNNDIAIYDHEENRIDL